MAKVYISPLSPSMFFFTLVSGNVLSFYVLSPYISLVELQLYNLTPSSFFFLFFLAADSLRYWLGFR